MASEDVTPEPSVQGAFSLELILALSTILTVDAFTHLRFDELNELNDLNDLNVLNGPNGKRKVKEFKDVIRIISPVYFMLSAMACYNY